MKIAIDIGATNTRIGLFHKKSELLEKKKIQTPATFKDGVDTISQEVKKLTLRNEIQGIALVVPAIIERDKGKITYTDHLPDWNNRQIIKPFEKTFGVPVSLENDAAAAALGEACFGVGKGKEIVAYLTLSTGVGGARVINGNLDRSAVGFEPGHQVIVPGGRYWKSCQQEGCLEAYVSGTAFYEIYGVKPEDCGDKKIWRDWSKYLAYGLVNIAVLWSPHIIVLGGGLANKANLFRKYLREFVKKNLKFMNVPEITVAALGDDAGLFGGLTLISD